MLEYKPEKKMAGLFEPFGVWIQGVRYEVKTLSVALYNALLNLHEDDRGHLNNEAAETFAREIMGEEEYKKTAPHNAVELQMLAAWMFKEFFGPMNATLKDAKAEKEKNAVKTPA